MVEPIIDETHVFDRRGTLAKLLAYRFEDGKEKYSFAYIRPVETSVDHGRILGYDNAHGVHDVHFRGEQRELEVFPGIEPLFDFFWAQVEELRRDE